MAAPAMRNSWRSSAVGATMMALAAFGIDGSNNQAHAGELGPDCQFSEQTLPASIGQESHVALDNHGISDLIDRAGDYSELDNGGVGVVVLIGNDFYSKGLSPELAANVIQSKLSENEAPSLVCYGYIGDKPSSVSFLLKNEGIGPVSPGEAVDQAPSVALKYKVQDSIASLKDEPRQIIG